MDDMAATLCSGPPRIAEARPDTVRCDERPARTGAPLVPGARPRPAVACPGGDPVGDPGQRVHAPADAGRPRAARLDRLAGDVADPVRPRRSAGRRGGPGLGPARLPATGAAPARRGPGDRGTTRRPGAGV